MRRAIRRAGQLRGRFHYLIADRAETGDAAFNRRDERRDVPRKLLLVALTRLGMLARSAVELKIALHRGLENAD